MSISSRRNNPGSMEACFRKDLGVQGCSPDSDPRLFQPIAAELLTNLLKNVVEGTRPELSGAQCPNGVLKQISSRRRAVRRHKEMISSALGHHSGLGFVISRNSAMKSSCTSSRSSLSSKSWSVRACPSDGNTSPPTQNYGKSSTLCDLSNLD